MPEQEYAIIRSKRKTLSIQITRAGELVVRAPLHMPVSRITDFVKNHESWIEKHLEKTRRELEQKQGFTFSDGQHAYFFGEKLTIRTDNDIKSVQVIGDSLLIPDTLPEISRERAIVDFLSRQASIYLQKRLDVFSRRMDVVPQGFAVTGAKTRWGSCSGKNRVCFSFRLICLPPELIDYVVVHELAHILHHNHSPRFYAQIAQFLPDYKQRQNALKSFQKLLTF